MALTDYTPTDWQNEAAGGTPLDADHLNKIESGISEVTQAVTASQTAQNTVVDISNQVTKLSSASNVSCTVKVVNGNELAVSVAWDSKTPDADEINPYDGVILFRLPDNVRPLVGDNKIFLMNGKPDAIFKLHVTVDRFIDVSAPTLGGESTTVLSDAACIILTPINSSLL